MAFVCAGPILATPPQIVSVRDTLFARTDDSLLILRAITDNHGLYTSLQTDTLLVTRSLTDGQDRIFQPVERVVEFGPNDAPQVTYLPLADPANPFAIRSELGAWPLQNPTWDTDIAMLTSDGLRLTARNGDTFGMALVDLNQHIETTLTAGRNALPVYFMEGDVDPFDPAAYDALLHCVPTSSYMLYHFDADPALVELACDAGDTGQQATLWIVLPQL